MKTKTNIYENNLAIHEAGHALLLSGYSRVPDAICVAIDASTTKNTYRGFLYHNVGGLVDPKSSSDHIKLSMLMSLAGYIAENQISTDKSKNIKMNSNADLRDWEELYIELASIDKNVKEKEALKLEQEKMLDKFMKRNIKVLNELAGILIKEKMIYYSILKPIIEKVEHPKDFPYVELKLDATKPLVHANYGELTDQESLLLTAYSSLSQEEKLKIHNMLNQSQ